MCQTYKHTHTHSHVLRVEDTNASNSIMPYKALIYVSRKCHENSEEKAASHAPRVEGWCEKTAKRR